MYWKFCVKRVFTAFFTFCVIMFVFSLLFNTTMEKTVRSLIEDQIKAEITALVKTSNMNSEQMVVYREQRREDRYKLYNLDKSFMERVIRRTINTITFNFGQSTMMRSSKGSRDVGLIVKEVVPRTMFLFTTVVILNLLIGIWLGILKSRKPGKLLDNSTTVATMVVFGMPSWWLGMITIMLFAYVFKILPSGGMYSTPPFQGFARFIDLLYHLILPLFTLLMIGFWGMSFTIRNIMLGIMQEDYIMTARARGINEKKVLFGHGLRSAAPPIVTMSVISLLFSISGNLVFEGIFNWPGLGNLYWTAVQTNDVPVLMGNLAVTTGIMVLGFMFLDMIYGFLDPRIRVGGMG